MESISKNEEQHVFDADIAKVLDIVTNSLYTNKDIFLRELVSNASDAHEKLRYESHTNTDIKLDSDDIKIKIEVDKNKGKVIITDVGIGMSKEELTNNLGTIAKSGTQSFLEKLEDASVSKDNDLIGQFGVGFYSSFMVAEEVDVVSRKADSKECWLWSSNGRGNFIVKQLDDDSVPCGTNITLILKEEYKERYTDTMQLKHVLETYCMHVNSPIEIIGEESDSIMISKAALWTRMPSEVTKEEHMEFFKSLSGGATDEPWMILHNRNEGAAEFVNLLYIPSFAPFGMFDVNRRCAVKLYCQKVFITEDADLIPKWFRFIKGVVDSSDIPLNISRETVQSDKHIPVIKKALVRKIMKALKDTCKSDSNKYLEFWRNFGEIFKEGICEALNTQDRNDILEISKFHSISTPAEQYISIDDYIENMADNQQEVYYLIGDKTTDIRSSAQLEGFVSRGIDVLLLDDHVDKFWTINTNEYKGKSLKSITSSGIDLDEFAPESSESKEESKEEENKVNDDDLQKLIDYMTEQLKGKVDTIQISKKLIGNPACISSHAGGMDIGMQQFLKEQNQLKTAMPKIMEINPKHQIIKGMAHRFEKNGADDQMLSIYTSMLFDNACISEKEAVADFATFFKNMNHIMLKALDS